MRVKKCNIYTGYLFVCDAVSEEKMSCTLFEKNVVLIKLKDGTYVDARDLIGKQGKGKEILRAVPHLYTKPTKPGELFVDERLMKQVYSQALGIETVNVNNLPINSRVDFSY